MKAHARLAMASLVVTAGGVALPKASASAEGAAESVMTQILGPSLDYRTPPRTSAVIERAFTDLADKGFSFSWDASPALWTCGLLENQALWKHWYGWRTEVYEEWGDRLTTAAHDTWSGRNDWYGCAFAAPYYWYDPALGLDLDKIASLRHVDYVVAGYYSGKNFHAVRDAALSARSQSTYTQRTSCPLYGSIGDNSCAQTPARPRSACV